MFAAKSRITKKYYINMVQSDEAKIMTNPTHFYKVFFDSVGMDAIAFIVPHRKKSKSELSAFIVSVDEVELRSGFDFNSLLDDAIEDDIEDDVEQMW